VESMKEEVRRGGGGPHLSLSVKIDG